jgi:flagellar assembly protein FliH
LKNNNFRHLVCSENINSENHDIRGKIVNSDHFKRIYFDDINESLSEFSNEFKSNYKSRAILNDGAVNLEQNDYMKGFEDGKIEGMRVERQKIFPKLNFINQAVSEIEKYKTIIYKNAEKKILDLSLAISRKIILNEVLINKDIVLAVLRESLKKIMNDEKVTVKLNHDDLQFINENKDVLKDIYFKNNTVKFVEDNDVEIGGCLIETDSGVIDGRIESQLNVIEESVAEAIKR